MKVLYVNSNIIAKNDIVWGFLEAGMDVELLDYRVNMNSIVEQDYVTLMKSVVAYDIVVSQNFIPVVAVVCHEKTVKYASWIYDSPQYHLFSSEALFDTNYVFTFDKKQVDVLKKFGIPNVFYLPLAGNVAKASAVSIDSADEQKYSCDISFVGNLYERATYRELYEDVPEDCKVDLEAQLSRVFLKWGKGINIYGGLNGKTSAILAGLVKDETNQYNIDPLYCAETLTLVYELANRERKAILEESARYFNTVLYTKKPELADFSERLVTRGPVYESDMYKAYYLSKINLNVTMRSIESGIPQRVFDVMSVGGCVFTNWQEEVEELFDIDKDIVVYGSMDEYLDKARFYLAHNEAREKVGIRGYLRVRDEYNYKNATLKIVSILSEN